MPRYFFDLYNDFDSRDEQGVELSSLKQVRDQVRRTLPMLLAEIEPARDVAQFRVEVRDEAGRRVVTSTILMVIEETARKEVVEVSSITRSSTPIP